MKQVLLVLGLLFEVILGSILFVGTEDNFLYSVNFNEQTGAISLLNTTSAVYPSFSAWHYSGEYFYTVNEVDTFEGHQNSGGITAYKVDAKSGAFRKINSVPSRGGSPAYITFDATYKWLAVANYDSGNYGVWALNSDYSVENQPQWFHQDVGKGPLPNQDGPHAHEFVFDPTNKIAIVPDLGNDQWNQYLFDATSGALTPLAPFQAPPGSGPRHFVFHPSLPYAYGISEMASTITVFEVPRPFTSLQLVQRISTLQTPTNSSAAELQFSPDGTLLYASNRLDGKNGTIVVFSIDKATGKLTPQQYSSTLGITPRYFTLSKDGHFILVANQVSNNLRVFERDQGSGFIGKLVGWLDTITAPSFIFQS